MIFVLPILLAFLVFVCAQVRLWSKKEKRIESKLVIFQNYWLVYTIGFAAIACLVFFWFLISEKSFVWKSDGQKQHLVSLMYYSQWLKDIVQNLIQNHKLEILLWDMKIGYGSDVITTLNYYVLGDPLNLLSVFFNIEDMETCYTMLIILRFFLTGVSFACYCFYRGHGKTETLIGSYLYCFAGYAVFFAVRHPYFINPMIYLPFVLLGVEKIYKKEKPHIFIIATAVAAASNFYFCYMIVLFTIGYVMICYYRAVGMYKVKEIVGWIVKFAFYGMVALLLAAIIFFPMVNMVLSLDRMGVENYIPVLFPMSYYENLIVSLVSSKNVGYGCKPNVAVSGMLAVFLLFAKKGSKELKVGLLLVFGSFCIPYVGHVLNGFSYVTYRCSFVMAFLLAYTFVKMYPSFFELKDEEVKKVCVFTGVYATILIIVGAVRNFVTLGALSLFVLCFFLILIGKEKIVNKNAYYANVFLIMTVVSIGFNAFCLYSPTQSELLGEYVDKGSAVARLSNRYDKEKTGKYFQSSDLIRDWDTQGKLSRVEIYNGKEKTENTNLSQSYYGVNFYFSLRNPYVTKFFREMGLSKAQEYRNFHLDCRGYLEALSNVEYFIGPKYKGEGVYANSLNYRTEALSSKKGYALYQAKSTMGFAYGYDSCINRTDYEKMNVAQKQEVLLKQILIEDNMTVEGVGKKEVDLSCNQKDYRVEIGKSIIQNGNTFQVMKKNAKMTLFFEGDSNSETYLYLEGIDYCKESPWDQMSKAERAKLAPYDQFKKWQEDISYVEPSKTTIEVSCDFGNGGKKILYGNSKYNYYCGIEDFLCNLGYDEHGGNSVTIKFAETGTYTIGAVHIFCQPMNDLEELIQERKIDGGDSFTIGNNCFDGTVTLDKKQMVCFSIPYSKGWSVYVDGKEQELLQANTMYMAVPVDAGTHQIHLSYCTPFLKEGIGATLLALILLIIIGARENVGQVKKKC